MLGIALLSFYGIYAELISGEAFGSRPLPYVGMLLFPLLALLLIGMFLYMRLKTEIDQREIRFSFRPFVKKRVSWAEVKSARVVNYGFVGGWGIRLWTRYGTVYNIRGNKGLALELLNGKKFLIGTQREAELQEFLKKREVEQKPIP